jgi:hypothetical protein
MDEQLQAGGVADFTHSGCSFGWWLMVGVGLF